jgi:predicted nucleic acid-binding protein
VLLDTSGLLCCFDADESRHGDAVRLYDAAGLRLTHNYVVAEFVALAQARRFPRETALAFAADVLADSEIEIVWVDQTLHDEALRLLRSQLDKTYSLCDAVSFIIMQRRAVSDALTTDAHFEQAGLRRMLPR